MSDLSSDYPSPKAADSELQDFLLQEKQKAQFHAQVNTFCIIELHHYFVLV